MRTHSDSKRGTSLRTVTLLVVYPALRQLPQPEWGEALKLARETNLDTIEWTGVLAGIACVTYLLRFDADQAALTLPARYLIQFLGAAPLLALALGPFYLRRTRRGLDQEIERRHGAGPSPAASLERIAASSRDRGIVKPDLQHDQDYLEQQHKEERE